MIMRTALSFEILQTLICKAKQEGADADKVVSLLEQKNIIVDRDARAYLNQQLG
tara:strand:- start:10 stop:171 length:162 start_codon:yes stop_codon:yes gene_type:complete